MDEYEQWQLRVLAVFLLSHPGMEECGIEISEDGTVFVHLSDAAYPLIFKGYECWVQ